MIAYFDTSAFVKLLVPESGAVALQAEVTEVEVRLASAVLEVEAVLTATRRGGKALARIARHLVNGVELIPVTPAVRQRAGELTRLRALDAIHLASALEAPRVDAFYCYDARLAEVARAAGLSVRSPGYAAGHGGDD